MRCKKRSELKQQKVNKGQKCILGHNLTVTLNLSEIQFSCLNLIGLKHTG